MAAFRMNEALRVVFRSVHTESGLMLFSLIDWEFPDHQAREFTHNECFNQPLEPFLQVLDGRFRLFALMRVSFASKVVLISPNLLTGS